MTRNSGPSEGSPEETRPELQVSHADRDRVVDALTAAASEGRLAAAELEERGSRAVRPDRQRAGRADRGPAAERQAKDVIRIDQRFGDMTRQGQWVVPRRMEIKLTAGDVKLDFTRAVIV